ncbi:MAG: methyltransferase domain-containing protein, partial [Candidatus Woesearchaeota archaeon]
ASARDFSRLAYTKNVYELLLDGSMEKIKKELAKCNLDKHVPHTFKIEDHTKKLLESTANCINKPVAMKNPGTLIEIFKIKNKIYITKLLQRIKHDFEKRKPHKRPICFPFSLKPKIARAMINLTGAKRGETILDPFCGTGGLLLEAGLIGCRVEGIDIDPRMIETCKRNLESYGVWKYNIYEENALNLKQKILYIATDLPYSRNTKKQDLEKLYEEFFKVVKKYLEYRAVIGAPDFVDTKKLIKTSGLKIVGEFSYFLHKTLTKKIFVLKPNN